MTRRNRVSEAVVQPISGTSKAERRDWTARTRDTAFDALRYSRFVAVMKRALPISAAALIAAVIAYSLIPRQSEKLSLTSERVGRIENDLAMLKPRLSGVDNKGNPFVITADAAVQDGTKLHRATLKNVQADLTLEKSRWLNATAAKGLVDMDKGTLALTGGISVFSDDGYELHTARADVDLRKGLFRGPVEVTGQGPTGTLRADTFEVDRATNQIVLQGHVHMIIFASESGRP
ncbi:MAG TPA: LPS export ABC transporter periplasmic protein LptC [Rhizomicrobium sp.]|nr:LPS export ABC transporter periplasmic protein LptC [Rhizomicrobium sp.]